MARSEKDTANPASIDAILRGLTQRPNVESTLILSRKDGSIIKAVGRIVGQGDRLSMKQFPSQIKETENGAEHHKQTPDAPNLGSTAETAERNRSESSPVEKLASIVYHFVHTATVLGATLNMTADSSSPPGSQVVDKKNTQADTSQPAILTDVDDEEEHAKDDTSIQLLRLRTSAQEIIIFPDPDYLCCVVQRVGRAASASDGR